jgi:PE family
VLPAAADEISAGVAHLLSAHAQDYRVLAGQTLTGNAASYAAEVANAAVLQPLTAIAGPVAGATAAAANPLTAWFIAVLSQLRNAIGSIIFFLLSPIINPIINAISQAVAQAIVQAISGAL